MHVIYTLLHPLVQVWLLLLVSGVLYYSGKLKWSKYLLWLGLGWFFILSVSPLPTLLGERWEQQYGVLKDVEAIPQGIPIVVLGGGHTDAPSLPVNAQLSHSALARLTEGMRLYRQINDTKLLCSGGKSTRGEVSQAELLGRTAVQLGIPPADTLLHPYARNTAAEAKTCRQRFGENAKLILVTNAIHMPRAIFWFKSVGLQPIPAPTNHYIKDSPYRAEHNFIPSAHKIELSDRLLHEYIGMLVAFL